MALAGLILQLVLQLLGIFGKKYAEAKAAEAEVRKLIAAHRVEVEKRRGKRRKIRDLFRGLTDSDEPLDK